MASSRYLGLPSGHRSAWAGGVWTCKVLPLVVFVWMPVVDSRPLLPPRFGADAPGGHASVCRVVEECVEVIRCR